MVEKPRRHHRTPALSLARNTVAQASSQLVAYLLSFAQAPFVLNGLGLRNFGVWALTGALAQYGGLLDLGVGRALNYFAALYESRDEPNATARAFAVGACVIPAVSLVLVLAAWVTAGPLARSVGGVSVGEMRFLLLVSALMLTSSMTIGFVNAYAIGLRRMVAPNVATSLAYAVNFVFSVAAVLVRPHDLPFYAGANLAASLIATAIVFAIAASRRMLPPLAAPTRRMTREVLSYSIKTQVVWLAQLVNFQTDKIVIAIFVGPRAAGAYEIANRVAAAARASAIVSISALIPTLTEQLVRAGREALRATYLRLSQRTAALSVPWLFGAAALAPSLLPAWLGQTPPDSVIILAALSLAYVPNSLTGASYAVAAASGAPGLPARSNVATAVLNLVLTAALAPPFGTYGVLAGTFIALSVGAFVQLVLVHRRFELSTARFIAAVRPPVVIGAVLAAPLGVAAVAGSSGSRAVCAAVVVAGGSAYFAAYLVLAAKRRLLPEAMTRLIASLSRRLASAPS